MDPRCAALVTLACVACATVPRGDDGRVHALAPDALERVPIAARFDEPVALVDDYVGASAVSDALRRAVPEDLRERLVHDPRLDHVARVRGQVHAATKGQRLGDELEAQLLWRVGVTLPLIGSDVWVTDGRAGLGATEVAAAAADIARTMPPDGRVRFGVARFFAGKRVAIAVVRVRELVDFDVLPRGAAPSEVVRIAGKAKADLIAPVLSILEDGVVRELPVEIDEDARFAVDVPLGESAGVRWLELRDMGGRRVIAWWPLEVNATGVVPPATAQELEALARTSPDALARGATRPSAESIVTLARELGVELPERIAELDTAAMLVASSPDELPTSRPPVCGEMWWLRFTARTEEELLWRARRSPATIALVRERARYRAGVAVARIEGGWRTALVECDRASPRPADSAPAAPVEAKTPADASGTHVVALTSTPAGAQAWIRIDGEIKLLCKATPCTAELPAGKKILIELRLDGYTSAQRTFTVEEGARFDGVLEPKP